MATAQIVYGDLQVTGAVIPKSLLLPAGSVPPAALTGGPGSYMPASIAQQQYEAGYSQVLTVNAATDRKVAHGVRGATATIQDFVVGAVTACTGTGNAVFDLLKNQVVTGITVEYRTPAGVTVCATNPDNCCPVFTGCCPGVVIPTTLCLTIASSDCSCLAGSYLLKWAGGTAWQSDPIAVCGCHITMSIFCLGSEWGWRFWDDRGTLIGVIAGGETSDFTCSPFTMSFTAGVTDLTSEGDPPPCAALCPDGSTLTCSVSADLTACGGSGSGGGSTCGCPNADLPSTAFAHISASGCDDGSTPLCPVGVGAWSGSACSCTVQLACSGGEWQLTLTNGATSTFAFAASVSCSPFQLVFTGVDFTPCGGSAGATVTVLAS